MTGRVRVSRGTAGAAVWLANFLLLRKRRPPAGGARLPTRGCLAGIARNPRSWFVVAAGALEGGTR